MGPTFSRDQYMPKSVHTLCSSSECCPWSNCVFLTGHEVPEKMDALSNRIRRHVSYLKETCSMPSIAEVAFMSGVKGGLLIHLSQSI